MHTKAVRSQHQDVDNDGLKSDFYSFSFEYLDMLVFRSKHIAFPSKKTLFF